MPKGTLRLVVFFSLIIFLVSVCLGVLFIHNKNKNIVILTDDGFYPKEIVIELGESVTFITKQDKSFWPAANLHPSHTTYPDFDSRGPVESTSSWSFTFENSGNWKYHNHLDPEKVGVVVVLDEDRNRVTLDTNDCSALKSGMKTQCYDEIFAQRLHEEGFESAFSYFLEIHAADSEVAQVCHGWMHELGVSGYTKYKEEGVLRLRPESSYCSYGFFHGLINAMIADTHQITTARNFCEQAVAVDGEVLHGLQTSCAHGIGHSFSTLLLEDLSIPRDFLYLTEKAEEGCDELYQDEAFRDQCYDGMFHELILVTSQGAYEMSPEEYMMQDDLYYLCRQEKKEAVSSCLSAFVSVWPYFSESKEEVLRSLVDVSRELDVDIHTALRSLVRSFIEIDLIKGNTFDETVSVCAELIDDTRVYCIEGLAAGLITHGDSVDPHIKAFDFCFATYVGDDKDVCIEKVVQELWWNYTPEHFNQACEALAVGDRPELCENP